MLDVCHEHGQDVVVAEYVPGETLAQLLRRGRVPEPLAARLAAQVAEGLAAGHEPGVVHRHLNPRNVFVTPVGTRAEAEAPTASLPMIRNLIVTMSG